MVSVKSKKVLIAAGLYPPDIGGPATYATMLEKVLPEAGIEPVVVPFGTVRHLPKVIRHFAYAKKLWREAKDCGAVYALDPVSVGLPALLISKLRRKPFLIRLGGDYAWEQGRMRFGLTSTLDEYAAEPFMARPLPVRLLASVQSFVVRRATLVISPSEYLKRIILTWGVKAEKVKVVHSALYPLPVSGVREQLRDQLNYTDVTLVTAARLTPWKGIDTVLAATKQLNETGLTVSLIIAGDGEAKESLEKIVRELGLSEKVRFVGKLSKAALGAAIKAADVFVYNTSYEGLPHQLLEVMDLGVPIVTTDIPGNREVITNGQEGLLIPPNDLEELTAAIRRVIENQQLRSRLTQNARLRVKKFAKEIVTEDLIDQLETILTQ